MMYSFAQRSDTTVLDEPYYAYYLATTKAREYHPGADEVLATMEQNGRIVTEDIILADYDTPIVFFKMMIHHIKGLDWRFLSETVNILLTRNPVDMLPSFAKNVRDMGIHDTGYPEHLEMFDYLQSIGQTPPVLESKTVLKNPKKVLQQLCKQIDIPFDDAMLSWEAGARPEDGSWAKYWYHSVHQSTGFAPYKPKNEPFPPHLEPLLAEM